MFNRLADHAESILHSLAEEVQLADDALCLEGARGFRSQKDAKTELLLTHHKGVSEV